MNLTAKIIIAVLVCLSIGFLSGISTVQAIEGWYMSLHKPFFNPPNWIFGPVWTLLYTMMGIAFALVWHNTTAPINLRKSAQLLFLIQLILNALWSPLFFVAQTLGLALLEILAMLSIIIICTIQYSKIERKAAWLLIPYIAWVSFATLLNAAYWYLN